jgi:hypothetical protein
MFCVTEFSTYVLIQLYILRVVCGLMGQNECQLMLLSSFFSHLVEMLVSQFLGMSFKSLKRLSILCEYQYISE